jgi:2,3-bisphosphoglycerate-independent phosphoglycerate mutase
MPRSVSTKPAMAGGPVVLLILDGWGIAPAGPGNAITLAGTPNIDRLTQQGIYTELQADGPAVGLPVGHVGNSEAGHMNLGAGRIVDQEIVQISKDIRSGKFFRNPGLAAAAKHVRARGSALHLMGLLSNGQSGHSSPDHVQALLKWSREQKIPRVYLHLFTDGRDAPPQSALQLLDKLQKTLKTEQIATIMGRWYAMDRKKDWRRTRQAYEAMTSGKGINVASAYEAVTRAYARGTTDEFIPPSVVTSQGKPIGAITDRDAVIFFNLRSDRARQLTKPFVQANFTASNPKSFTRKKILHDVRFVAMTNFGPDLDSIRTCYVGRPLASTLPKLLAAKRQVYIAEREKYAHVSFFFNGGHADPVAGENRVFVSSPNVINYAKTPAMATATITRQIVRSLRNTDFICANIAAPDMIGHTGNLIAAVRAVHAVDRAIGKIAKAVATAGGTLLITADHGNVERLHNTQTGAPDTEHNLAPVPFIAVGPGISPGVSRVGKLADVAPTILDIMQIKRPSIMTGRSLL